MIVWRKKKRNSFTAFSAKKSGLYFRVQKDVDPEVRRACLEFGAWLRKNYDFPVRVIVYIKAAKFVRESDGELIYHTIWEPFDKETYYPYARISTGYYEEDLKSCGKDNALCYILTGIATMLSCYKMWLNDLTKDLTENEELKLARKYGRRLIVDYSKTRDHP